MSRLSGSILLIILISSVLASCASTEVLTPTATWTPTDTLPTFDVSVLTPPPGTMQCTTGISQEQENSPLAQPSNRDHWFGADDPTVTMIVYFDLECPYCSALHPILRQLADEYPQQLQVIYRQFPAFMVHDKALLAAQALEAAASQDESVYFPLVDVFYQEQAVWTAMQESEFSSWLLDHILALGLDRDSFEAAMADTSLRDQLISQLDADVQSGVLYTPFVIMDGQVIANVPSDLNTMRSMLELSLLNSRLFADCPPPLLEKKAAYQAVLHTDKGDITLQLFPEIAPQAVNNFIFLAQEGWYDDIPFYRVIPDSYALSGDPSGTGLGNPGYTFASEIDPVVVFDRPGVVAMNNTGAPDTNGSNFFITYQALPELDGAFTIFGQVIDGMDVLQSLTPRDPVNDPEFIPADRLLSVTIQQQ